MSTNKLFRSRNDRVIAGICGGLGMYFNIDPVIIRILWVILSFSGGGILAYIICIFVIPEEPWS